MTRYRLLAAIGLTAILWSSVPAVAASPAAAPSSTDCGTIAHTYPERWAAEGATFLGRVIGKRTFPDRDPVYRLAVSRVFAGAIEQHVKLRTSCVDTRLRLGERYLISSSRFTTEAGHVATIIFGSAISVGWHVAEDGSIRLLGYGPGLGEPPKPYLTTPDTVLEAAHAVALGIQEQGTCVGGEDHIRAQWRMEVDRIHGELEVVVAIEGRPDRHWTVELFHDYARFVKQQRVDDFEIVRHVGDRPGTDRISFKAVQADGQVCRGVINA